jgi:hypothetical protein
MHVEFMRFSDLTLREVSVEVDGPPKRSFILRECKEGDAVRYRNEQMRAAKMHEGKLVSLDGVANVEPLLVSMCLFELEEQEDRTTQEIVTTERPVTIAEIREMPPRFVKQLFEKAREISELGEQETIASIEARMEADRKKLVQLRGEDPAKNGQSSTPASSEQH